METTETREDAGKALGRLPSVVPIRPQRCAALPNSGAGGAAAAHVEAAQAPPTPPPGARPLMTGGSSVLITAALAPAAPGAHPPGPGAGRGLEPPQGPSAPSLLASRPGLAERRPRADPRRYVKSSGTFAPLTRLRLCNRGAPARVPPPGQWGSAEPAAAANRATRGRDRVTWCAGGAAPATARHTAGLETAWGRVSCAYGGARVRGRRRRRMRARPGRGGLGAHRAPSPRACPALWELCASSCPLPGAGPGCTPTLGAAGAGIPLGLPSPRATAEFPASDCVSLDTCHLCFHRPPPRWTSRERRRPRLQGNTGEKSAPGGAERVPLLAGL